MMSDLCNFQEIPNWQEQWNAHQSDPEDLTERDKRYGRVFDLFDEEDQFVVRVYLPQRPPKHPWLYQYGLSKTLQPYKVEGEVIESNLVISGLIQDEDLAKLCGLINSFPDRFEIKLPLDFTGKNLEITHVEDYIVDVKLLKR